MTNSNLKWSLAAAFVCSQIFLSEAQAPSFKPSVVPTPSPSYIATAAPSNPTMAPSFSPTSAYQQYITKGGLAAAVICSCVAFTFILMMFIYLCKAPKGSSPLLFYFPSTYVKFYPGREKLVNTVGQTVIEKAELIDDGKVRTSEPLNSRKNGNAMDLESRSKIYLENDDSN